MNLHLTGHHVDITPPIRQYVSSKLARITHHFDHLIEVNVILSVEKLLHRIEANVHLRARTSFARMRTRTCTPRSTAWWTSSTGP
jgi:putative sigma-54 modulation protein